MMRILEVKDLQNTGLPIFFQCEFDNDELSLRADPDDGYLADDSSTDDDFSVQPPAKRARLGAQAKLKYTLEIRTQKEGPIAVISDIHGSLWAIKIAYKFLEENENGVVVFLGDYIDRETICNGSFYVLLSLYQLRKKYRQQVILLRGNHEEMTFKAIQKYRRNHEKYINCFFWAGHSLRGWQPIRHGAEDLFLYRDCGVRNYPYVIALFEELYAEMVSEVIIETSKQNFFFSHAPFGGNLIREKNITFNQEKDTVKFEKGNVVLEIPLQNVRKYLLFYGHLHNPYAFFLFTPTCPVFSGEHFDEFGIKIITHGKNVDDRQFPMPLTEHDYAILGDCIGCDHFISVERLTNFLAPQTFAGCFCGIVFNHEEGKIILNHRLYDSLKIFLLNIFKKFLLNFLLNQDYEKYKKEVIRYLLEGISFLEYYFDGHCFCKLLEEELVKKGGQKEDKLLENLDNDESLLNELLDEQQRSSLDAQGLLGKCRECCHSFLKEIIEAFVGAICRNVQLVYHNTEKTERIKRYFGLPEISVFDEDEEQTKQSYFRRCLDFSNGDLWRFIEELNYFWTFFYHHKSLCEVKKEWKEFYGALIPDQPYLSDVLKIFDQISSKDSDISDLLAYINPESDSSKEAFLKFYTKVQIDELTKEILANPSHVSRLFKFMHVRFPYNPEIFYQKISAWLLRASVLKLFNKEELKIILKFLFSFPLEDLINNYAEIKKAFVGEKGSWEEFFRKYELDDKAVMERIEILEKQELKAKNPNVSILSAPELSQETGTSKDDVSLESPETRTPEGSVSSVSTLFPKALPLKTQRMYFARKFRNENTSTLSPIKLS